MNKNKIYYLLLGIGLGVLITSSMNIVFNKTEKVEYSEEEIREEAKELGMVSIKDNIEKNKEEEQAKEEAQANEAKEKALKEKAEKEKAEKEEEQEKEADSVIVSITSEDGASSIIEKLKANDIIDDQQEFKDLVTEYNLEKKFRTGEYEIQKNSSYAEVLKRMIREDELKDAGFL